MNRNSLRRSSVMLVLPALCLLLLAGCSGTNTHLVTSIDVTPHNPSISVGTMQQFTATAQYGNGAVKDVTSQVTWNSDTPADATITAGGLASGVAPGSAKTITVAPPTPTIAVAATVDFVATGHYSDGSSQVLPGVTWGTGTPATASITTTGVAVALAAGSSQITATFTGVQGNTLLTVQPAFARNAYASGTTDSSIATYVLNSALPTLTPIASSLGSGVPVQVIPEPSGRFAYILNSNSIVTATVDPASGRLIAPTSQLNTAVNSDFAVVDPTGQYLYVVSFGVSSTLNPYLINLTDGSLSTIGAPVSGFSNLISVIVDRTGKYLYAVDNGVNKVFAYSIGAGGALTALATPNYPVGNVAQYPAIDPSNTYLYIPNQADNSISAFTINADGSLTAIAGSPFVPAPALNGPSYAAVDLTGKYLYVTNAGNNTVSGLTISAAAPVGALGAAVAGSPFAATNTPFGIAIDPTNTTLLVSNLFGNSINVFSLTAATGMLTPAPLPQVESPAGVYFINLGIGAASHTINPGAVFAANSVSGDISAFTSTAGTGVLAAAAASPFPGLAGNSFAAADLQGNFLFTGSAAGSQVGGFSVTQSSAALAALTGSPLTVTGTDLASALYVAPNDTFAYALDVTSGSVVQYTITPGTSTVAGPGATAVAFAGANNLAADPQGDFIFALGLSAVNGIQPFVTYSGGVGLVASTAPTSLPGNWTSGAVDGSGQFLVAVDSTAKTLQSFAITPAGTSGGAPFADGNLTAVGVPVAVNGPGIRSYVVAFDPLDRAVFVADQTVGTGTVTVYSFNPTTGLLGAAGAVTSVSANGLTQISTDITGSYLYVGIKAAAAPGSLGAVAVYTIGAGGSLTAVGAPVSTGTGNPGIAATNVVQ